MDVLEALEGADGSAFGVRVDDEGVGDAVFRTAADDGSLHIGTSQMDDVFVGVARFVFHAAADDIAGDGHRAQIHGVLRGTAALR